MVQHKTAAEQAKLDKVMDLLKQRNEATDPDERKRLNDEVLAVGGELRKAEADTETVNLEKDARTWRQRFDGLKAGLEGEKYMIGEVRRVEGAAPRVLFTLDHLLAAIDATLVEMAAVSQL